MLCLLIQNTLMNLMRTIIKYSLFLILLLESCTTVEKFNAQINTVRNVQDLKSDIDFIQNKLIKLHPDLYHYISKKNLNYKFDSLRMSVISPMTSNDFYFKLCPIITSIKEGHTQIFQLTEKLKYKVKKSVRKRGTSPFTQFDFELFSNKIYIVKNYSNDSTIKPGTEVLSVNGVNPESIIDKYRNSICSDGNNETFISRRLAKGFPRFFYYQNGITDSLCCQLKYNDIIRTVYLKRPKDSESLNIKKSKEQSGKGKKLILEENLKRYLFGYDVLKKIYSKQLSFCNKDSSIAVMKLSDFMKGNYIYFYKKSFKQLKNAHTKTLIIDLRDNIGGRLLDVCTLYSYLSDSSFHFLAKSEVTSKTSLWHIDFYKDKPLWLQTLIWPILIPAHLEWNIFTYLITNRGIDNKYKFPLLESRLMKPKSNRFKGKLYVITNGGCFSATSLLSTNLQSSQRAMFIGEETGGANNGCVAGFLPSFSLPKSKLTIRFGLLLCKTPYKTKVDGRGIFPDKEIIPTLQDRINGKDPELQWILNNVDNLNKESK